MSQQLIDRSADLKMLRDEGYDIRVRATYLVLAHVPYVNSRKEIQFGSLVSELTIAGDETTTPKSHVAYFIGEHPCNMDGTEIVQIKNNTGIETFDTDLVVNHRFSSKPNGGYTDSYHKMTTYVAIISSPAQAIDSTVTAKTFPVIQCEEADTVFHYFDTASSRAGINMVTKKLETTKVAIVGVGGTGSYILDLLAKTPVREIHLFDGDTFLNHNAFRSPGAPSVDELRNKSLKVNYFAGEYARMRRGIIPHAFAIDQSNIAELQGMNFVFLSLEGSGKRLIVDQLTEWNIPFIDVGMGIQLVDGALLGILRVTTSTTALRDHVWDKGRIPCSNGDDDNEYSRNIQIADLNALNAALAVVKWKKLCGFYHDLEGEHFSTYATSGNALVNEDLP